MARKLPNITSSVTSTQSLWTVGPTAMYRVRKRLSEQIPPFGSLGGWSTSPASLTG